MIKSKGYIVIRSIIIVLIGIMLGQLIYYIESPPADFIRCPNQNEWYLVNTNLYPACETIPNWKFIDIYAYDELNCKGTHNYPYCWKPIVKDFNDKTELCNFNKEDTVLVYFE